MTEEILYIHYASRPIEGEWILPWDELPDQLREVVGHQGRVHEGRFREQWRSDRVYVHELRPGGPLLDIGTTYSSRECWAYRVEPVPPLEPDPERGGHLASSRICQRARVLECLHSPRDSQPS